jgi:antitoxin CptB
MAVEELDSESLRRLRWQCRRGLLELDLLFTRFLDDRYDLLSESDQSAFHELLRQPDHSILAWLQGQEPAPDAFQNILKKLK